VAAVSTDAPAAETVSVPDGIREFLGAATPVAVGGPGMPPRMPDRDPDDGKGQDSDPNRYDSIIGKMREALGSVRG